MAVPLDGRPETVPIGSSGFDTAPRQDLVLSVVIPVYNERDTLPRIMRAAMLAAPGVAKEFVVVDDCSRDGTREWLKAAFPEESYSVAGVLRDGDGQVQFLSPDAAQTRMNDSYEPVTAQVIVRAVFHETNGGKGKALRTGFTAATGDVIVIQDADLEYDPVDWDPMLRLIQIGVADVVFGSRFSGRPHRSLYLYHFAGNKLISNTFNVLFDQTLSDLETCYKMFRRETLDGVRLISNDFGIEVELSARLAGSKRWRVYETAISYYGRTYSEGKKITWRDGIKALWYVFKFRFFSGS
jgi:glycosyltransferase involved in cell wall biosynthesis